MFGVSREKIENLRRMYPKGTRVELISMQDIQAPPIGTRGTIQNIDDIGNLIMIWDNGSTLSLIDGEDSFRIIE